MAYIRPSVQVIQEFGSTPVAGEPELNACIVGPNKKFLDYSISEDKSKAYVGEYDNSLEDTVPYPDRGAGEVVDASSVQLTFDQVKAKLYAGTDGATDTLEPNVLRSETSGFYFADFTSSVGVEYPKSSALHNRGVKVDDQVTFTDGVTSHTARVIGFSSEETAPVYGPFTADSQNHPAVNFVGVFSAPAVAVSAGSGTGKVGARGYYSHPTENTVYTVTCTTSGALGTAVFSLVDSGSDITGTSVINTVAGVTEYPIGSRGVILVLDDSGSTTFSTSTADVFTITCTAPAIQDGSLETSGAYTGSSDLLYTISVVDKGVSGVARVRVTTPGSVDDSGPHIVKDGVPFAIGSRGAQIKINFPSGGVLIPGDSWTVQARAGGRGAVSTVNDVGGEADTIVVSGSYSGVRDVALEVSCGTGGAFGTAVFTWTMYPASTAASRRAVIATGTITTAASDDSTTLYATSAGISVSLVPDGGTFTASHIEGASLYADWMELPAVSSVHDVSADAPSLVTLEAVPAEANFGTAVITENAAPSAGTYSLEGKYRHNEDTVYSITVDTAGPLGTLVLDVVDSGSDISGTETITTVAGVTRYFVGNRGLILSLSSNFSPGASFDIDLDTGTTAVPTATVTRDYAYSQKLVYEVTCTTGGALGTAAFSVTSTNSIDNDSFVTSVGVSEYDIGSRGIKVTFALGDASGFTVGQKWTIDVAQRSTYTREDSDTYTVQVTKSGGFGSAEVIVTSLGGDSSGPFVLQEDVSPARIGQSAAFKLGQGTPLVRMVDTARSTFSPDVAATFVEGDKWTIAITAEVIGGYNGLVLSKAIPASLLDSSSLDYSIFMSLSDVVIPEDAVLGGTNYVFDSTTVTIDSGITVQSPDVFDLVAGSPVSVNMPVQSGAKMYVTYSALDTSGTATLASVSSIDQIEGILGRIDPRNPLAYGVFKAMQNSSDPIFFVRVSSDDAVGYEEALNLLDDVEDVYALCPLTQDPSILGAFKSHVVELSDACCNKWRMVFVNQELTTQSDVMVQRVNSLGDLVDFTATITDDPDSADLNPPIFTKVTDSNADFITVGVTPGDVLLTDYVTSSSGELVATSSYEVDRVVSDEVLILKTGPNSPVTLAQKYQIVRPLSKDEQASNHAGVGASFGSRRVCLVWPDYLESEDGRLVPGYFACAALAGLVSALPPHQGLTNISLAGFTSASRSFDYFTNSQLDSMAEGGVFILTQTAIGSQVYVRHQLTTDMSTLESSELSIVKTLDYISADLRDAVRPFVGQYNVVKNTLDIIETAIAARFGILRSRKLPKIGAPIVSAAINFVRQNDEFKDQVDVDTDLSLPFPLNRIKLTLRV